MNYGARKSKDVSSQVTRLQKKAVIAPSGASNSETVGRKDMLNKVLVVDDSELIHNMYKLMLKKYPNCEVISALNGKDALEVLEREGDFDLILLDVNMPVMNGVQFLEHIREEGLYGELPVIIISTEGKEEDTLRGLSLGAMGYIVKPFKSRLLYGLIEDVFKQGSPSAN